MNGVEIDLIKVLLGFFLFISAFPLFHYILKKYWIYYKFYYGYNGDIGWVRNIAGIYIFSLIFLLITPFYFIINNSIEPLSFVSMSLFGMFYQMTMSDLKKSKAQIEQLKPNYNKYKEEIKPKLRWWVPLYVGAFILELIVINL